MFTPQIGMKKFLGLIDLNSEEIVRNISQKRTAKGKSNLV